MSGKSLKSMKDEKQELQKQIGCINGFFQLFYRQRLITGQGTNRYIQNASSSGVTNNGTKEQNSTMQKPKAKNQKIAREKQQFSTESSVTSVSSSSCSSSISSHEFNRITKIESSSSSSSSSIKQIRVPKNPHSKVSTKQHDTQSQQSLDFYDIIKDSMHREAKGLYVKTLTKQEKKGYGYALNQRIDSPRPITVSKEPLHTLSKSKKAHWDSPRLSYDALKSTTRYKELPRLSLDSKQGSVRGIDRGNKAHNVSNGSQRGYGRNSSTMLNQIQEPETSKRSSGVVAKLMGLELPDSTQTCRTSSCSTDKKEVVARTSTFDEYKKQQSSASPRNRRGDDSVTNVNPNSRFALESSPLRQPDASQHSLSQDSSKGSDSDIKSSKPSLSVYGEIEKRLAELEFKKSGKDLRALKQILEAMQRFTDSSPDTRNTNTSLSESFKVQSPRIQQKDSPSATVAVEMSNSIKGSKLPIIIMKPTKETKKVNNPPSKKLSIHDKSCIGKCSPINGILVDKQKSGSRTKNTKEPFGQQVPSADKNNYFRTSKLMQSTKSVQDSNGKNTTTSPRLPKKFGVERRSPPTSPSSDSVIIRRQQNGQLAELSTSSSSTSTQSFSISQDRDEHFSEMNSHWRKFKNHVNVISSDFGSNRSLANQSDIEVIQLDQSANINQNNTFEELRKENSKVAIIVTTEQPSPVSVLDAAFYKEDPPSPVKKISNISKKLGEALTTEDESEGNSVAQILQEIEWNDEKLVNFNNIKNPDHKYISEILIASGLVSDRNSNQILHTPGHLINPKLFFALEQMKTNKPNFNIEDKVKKITRAISPENVQRKLIFDVVNDILVKKLMYESSSSLCFLPNVLNGKRFFEELCTEIDELQPEKRNVSFVHEDENLISLLCRDLKDHNTIWTNCCSEIPNMVLDIERLIFKDLITEVCEDELQNNFGGHCRKMLFPK